MDQIFRVQKGRNVEVYIDDILIKLTTTDTTIINIKETFATLTRYGLKLNLENCIFSVKSRHFLSYVVTEMGIEATLIKV